MYEISRLCRDQKHFKTILVEGIKLNVYSNISNNQNIPRKFTNTFEVTRK